MPAHTEQDGGKSHTDAWGTEGFSSRGASTETGVGMCLGYVRNEKEA